MVPSTGLLAEDRGGDADDADATGDDAEHGVARVDHDERQPDRDGTEAAGDLPEDSPAFERRRLGRVDPLDRVRRFRPDGARQLVDRRGHVGQQWRPGAALKPDASPRHRGRIRRPGGPRWRTSGRRGGAGPRRRRGRAAARGRGRRRPGRARRSPAATVASALASTVTVSRADRALDRHRDETAPGRQPSENVRRARRRPQRDGDAVGQGDGAPAGRPATLVPLAESRSSMVTILGGPGPRHDAGTPSRRRCRRRSRGRVRSSARRGPPRHDPCPDDGRTATARRRRPSSARDGGPDRGGPIDEDRSPAATSALRTVRPFTTRPEAEPRSLT